MIVQTLFRTNISRSRQCFFGSGSIRPFLIASKHFPAQPTSGLNTHIPKSFVNDHFSSKNTESKSNVNCKAEPSVSDRFGLLSEAVDRSKRVSHKSLEGRFADRNALNAIDSSLVDPLEETESTRKAIRLRPQDPNRRLTWNARQIAIQCNGGNLDAAFEAFFEGCLMHDRVIPPRYLIHRLLGSLAEAGRSAQAFEVYRKMKEIGVSVTQATYSRLFRACAEDCCVWLRENQHLLPSLSASPHLSALQERKNQLMEKALHRNDLVQAFGGEGLRRARGLWERLRSDKIPLTPVTINALLLALAKGGDLTGCFQILDAYLSPVSPSTVRKNTREAFQPDSYTMTALLSAVRPASIKRHLVFVADPQRSQSALMTALDLSLTVWHRLLSHLQVTKLGPQCFVSLINAIRSNSDDVHKTKERILLFHPQTGLQSVRLTNSEVSVRLFDHAQPDNIVPLSSIIPSSEDAFSVDKLDYRLVATSTPEEKLPLLEQSTQLFRPDWKDMKLALRSPVNLLLPLNRTILIVPPTDRWLPWHRLALIGGLHGLLESVEDHYQSSVTPQLLTSLIGLIPSPTFDVTPEELDMWEQELIQIAKKRDIRLDIGFFNALIDRRTSTGYSGSRVLSEATRLGLIPDQITWGSLAKGCKTKDSVRRLLRAYAQASRAKSLRSILPSRTFFATLISTSQFNWDVKAYLLSLMIDSVDPDSGTFTGLEPDKRLVAQLEMDVALFREWLRKEVIPKDGSAVPPCSDTQGIAIPPHSAAAFRRFLPVYRKWLSLRYPSRT